MKLRTRIVFGVVFSVIIVYALVLCIGFFGVKWGLTNVSGIVDPNTHLFDTHAIHAASTHIDEGEYTSSVDEDLDNQIAALAQMKRVRAENYCKIDEIGKEYPVNAGRIIGVYADTGSESLVAKMIHAVQLRLQDNAAFQSKMRECENAPQADLTLEFLVQTYHESSGPNVFPWMNRPEWKTIREAVAKDHDALLRVYSLSGIEPRSIVSCMIVEQLRLFNSEREIFKRFFEPLKILGNANQMSLGIMGIKESTARQIEEHLQDPNSSYYLGDELRNILDYPEGDSSGEKRYGRLVDEGDNHYYSYLYGALYLGQIMKQWRDAGHDIRYRPEIFGTLFNIGFPQSKPKPNPKVGGASIDVGDGKYSFGSLVYEFYYSGEILDDFPYVISR